MQTKTQQQTRNGVDVTALAETMKAIENDGSLATFVFRSRNKWLDGGHNRTSVNEFYGAGQEHRRSTTILMDADEPPVLLGFDRAANPVEYVLHALAACVTTSMVYHAAARGVTIHEVETRLEGDLDLRGFLGMPGAKRNGYEGIKMTMKVKGDGPAERMREMVALGTGHSPVFDMVSNGTKVAVEVETA